MYNVLICDDQPDIVNALKIYLTPEGYNLFEAFTGTQAVEIAKNYESPEVVRFINGILGSFVRGELKE